MEVFNIHFVSILLSLHTVLNRVSVCKVQCAHGKSVVSSQCGGVCHGRKDVIFAYWQILWKIVTFSRIRLYVGHIVHEISWHKNVAYLHMYSTYIWTYVYVTMWKDVFLVILKTNFFKWICEKIGRGFTTARTFE